MPWVSFRADFDFTPSANRKVTVAYLAGMRLNVPREAAQAALAKGVATRIKAPASRAAARALLAET